MPTHPNILDPASWEYGHVRQWRGFEMTEFEWFHWWPFNLLIALICTNLVVATLRRIPFRLINLGVLMIHSGIIILALGSVWYFSTKVEGDAPVSRRRITIEAPGIEPVSMVALPGNTMTIGEGDNAYALQVTEIDPQWELLSGDDKGKKAYKVSVMVRSKAGMFIRQLLAGYPQYTEDVIRTDNPQQPMARAIKALGKPLVDEAIKMALEYDSQKYFYLMDSHALYLREVGQPEWVQRPIENLPRYNDYIASADDVWQAPNDAPLPLHPITNVVVPASDPNDPLPDVSFRVSRYLRYANLERRRRAAQDARFDPAISVRLVSPAGEFQKYDLVAFDPAENTALRGTLMFSWIDSSDTLERLKKRIDPVIRFSFPGTPIVVEHPVSQTMGSNPDLPFTPVEGIGYSYRVENFQDNLTIGDRRTSVAIIQIKTPPPERTFKRWVFDNASNNRDMAMGEGLGEHDATIPLDQKIETVYRPGVAPPAPILVLAGPGENDLAVLVTKTVGQPRHEPLRLGEPVPIAEGVTLVVDRYAPRTVVEVKPFVVPREQRDRDAKDHLSMVRLDMPLQSAPEWLWLPFHNYVFDGPEEVIRRFRYQPQQITLDDGRQIEFMFSRARLELPARVALEDFQVESHIGGFTGESSSILDWKSVVRFRTEDDWEQPQAVSVNKPAEHRGYWYFQAMWDPPDPQPRFEGDPGSRGLNYTVLGVGNRNGVHVQLAGCCIAVMGMIYAFYWKPVLKRRRQQIVHTEATSKKSQWRADRRADEPVGAAWKMDS